MAKEPYSNEPLFIADAMFARLARWLRVLGFDTAFDPSVHDHDLVSLAAAEGRILLTRDRHLVSHLKPQRVIHISADDPLEQLRAVVEECGLDLDRELFTRCLVCNSSLRAATKEEIRSLVPERARAAGGPVRRCPGCARVYWPGSHARRMRTALARVFPGRVESSEHSGGFHAGGARNASRSSSVEGVVSASQTRRK